MKMPKKIFLFILCLSLFCTTGFAEVSEPTALQGTFAFGCFGYEIPFLYTSDTVEQAPGQHTAYAASYTVTARRLETPVTDAESALTAAKSMFDSDAEIELNLSVGEDGVYSAMVTDTYAYCSLYIKDETALMFRCTDPQHLMLLDRQIVLLEEPVWGETADQPVQTDDIIVPQYLPFGAEAGSAGLSLDIWQQALESMLSSGTYGIYWDLPQYADATYDAVSGYITTLGRTVTLVYERETQEVQSVQWFSLLQGESVAADVYTATSAACETGAAVVSAMFFGDAGLDMAQMSANVSELQSSFTALQSWMSALTTESLQMNAENESSITVFGRTLTVRIITDPENGHRIEGCIQ